jgi:hypothetical protein
VRLQSNRHKDALARLGNACPGMVQKQALRVRCGESNSDVHACQALGHIVWTRDLPPWYVTWQVIRMPPLLWLAWDAIDDDTSADRTRVRRVLRA